MIDYNTRWPDNGGVLVARISLKECQGWQAGEEVNSTAVYGASGERTCTASIALRQRLLSLVAQAGLFSSSCPEVFSLDVPQPCGPT